MSDLSTYGIDAEKGEAAAKDALKNARADREPGILSAFLIDAAAGTSAFHDGALFVLCAMLVSGDAAA